MQYIITCSTDETHRIIINMIDDYRNLVYLPWTRDSQVGWILQANLTQEQARFIKRLIGVVVYKKEV